jgi:hypothetical protein
MDISEDERLARDMQMAMDLQAAEDDEQQQASRSLRDKRNEHLLENGLPTSFGIEHMLFVSCTVEGRKIEMLVDSGASTSAISMKLVKKLKLEKKLDRSICGKATGVGTANIEGILSNVNCRMGHVEFLLYFLVIDTSDPWLILGLDQMRRFKCLIDIENEKLVFGGKDGVAVPFLNKEKAAAAIAKRIPPTAEDPETQPAQQNDSNPVSRFTSFFDRR